MPLGVSIGQVVGLVRETRRVEDATPWISIAGDGAAELAAALAAGGDAAAVRMDGDPLQAAVAIRLIHGAASAAEASVLRGLTRAGSGVIVVQRGSGRVPYVLPGDILEVESAEVPLDRLVPAIARAAVGEDGPALAARLPVLRPAVGSRLITRTALANAGVAASSKPQAQLPVLTLAESRMVLLLGLSRGDTLPRDPQKLALTAGPAVAACVGMGLGARALVRRLPASGPLVRAAVAFAGTRALGAARLRL